MRTIVWALLCAVAAGVTGGEVDAAISRFEAPPVDSRPWTYWFVFNSQMDEATIDADFADIANLGFGGVLAVDSRGYWEDDDHLRYPPAQIRWGSAEWQKLIVHAVRAAARNGIAFTLNIAASGGHLRGEMDARGDNPKHLVFRRYLPGDVFEKPESPFFRDVAVFAVRTRERVGRSDWSSAGDGVISSAASRGTSLMAGVGRRIPALDVKRLKNAGDGSALGPDWTILRFGCDTVPGAPNDIDVLDPCAVERHLERSIGGIVEKTRDVVGADKTFRALYNVSWEGVMPTWSLTFERDFAHFTGTDLLERLPVLAGFDVPGCDGEEFMRTYRAARGRMMARNFYGTVKKWANERGMLAYSESGGPWVRRPELFGECDQLEFLSANDFPQGEFWPQREKGTVQESGHANANGSYISKGIVSAAHVVGAKYASAEAFTHMHRHWSVDPAFLKPVGDQAFADGINLFVWHTYTCSPARFGRPGVEYFAGSHINRNVTWHDDAAPFIKYIARCQSVLQAGEPVVDVLVVGGDNAYCGWQTGPAGGSPGNGRLRELVSDEPSFAVKIPKGYSHDFASEKVYSSVKGLDGRYKVTVKAKDAIAEAGLVGRLLAERGIAPDVETGDPSWTWCHRRSAAGDFYFIVGEGSSRVVLRCAAETLELWDPVAGDRRALAGKTLHDGRTEVSLDLPTGGSAIVAFLKNVPSKKAARKRPLDVVTPVAGAWDVSFSYPQGIAAAPPAPTKMERLVDFTQREDLKHFAGTAVYRTDVVFGGDSSATAVLSLGEVPSGLVRVFVNGKDCGTAWCAPWQVDVSGALHGGRNSIELRYVNNWHNRMIGDCGLEENDRVTRSNLHYWRQNRVKGNGRRPLKPTVYSGYCPYDPLQPSGLLGPVEIRSAALKESAR